MSDAPEAPVAGAQTLLRALDILDCFEREGEPLSLADISKAVGLKPPTTHRLVKALVSRGLLVADASRRYSLGPQVMKLASRVMGRETDLVALATPTLERLRTATRETVNLHCVLGDERICVAELLSPEPIRMESRVGRVYPLYAGAAGKALLAWLPDRLDDVLARLSSDAVTPVDGAALPAELEAVRRRGYATSESEVVGGAAALAVPVFGSSGGILAAINVVGPSARLGRTRLLGYREVVLAEASALMELLASTGPPPLFSQR